MSLDVKSLNFNQVYRTDSDAIARLQLTPIQQESWFPKDAPILSRSSLPEYRDLAFRCEEIPAKFQGRSSFLYEPSYWNIVKIDAVSKINLKVDETIKMTEEEISKLWITRSHPSTLFGRSSLPQYKDWLFLCEWVQPRYKDGHVVQPSYWKLTRKNDY